MASAADGIGATEPEEKFDEVDEAETNPPAP